MYILAKDLFDISSKEESERWIDRYVRWVQTYNRFLSQMSYDENGNKHPTHERLLKAQRSLLRLIDEGTMFTYLDPELLKEIEVIPSTNNRIEGGINSQLRAMLREHRGLSVERRIKAVFWWCYMHSPEPLSVSDILNKMPTDKSIAAIYKRMTDRQKLEDSIPTWGDAVVWGDFHKSTQFRENWD